MYFSILLLTFFASKAIASSLPDFVEKVTESSGLHILSGLSPGHFVADMNGDGKPDYVLFVKDAATGKKGICILHSAAKVCALFGAGSGDVSLGDDCHWLHTWELLPAGESWEVVTGVNGDLLGTRPVSLPNGGLRLCADEGGCAVIGFKDGAYVTIYQN